MTPEMQVMWCGARCRVVNNICGVQGSDLALWWGIIMGEV